MYPSPRDRRRENRPAALGGPRLGPFPPRTPKRPVESECRLDGQGAMTTDPIDSLSPELEGLFRERPVRLAYLFGSMATGRTHAGSDVDIAVLLDESLTADARFAERLELIGRLSRIFRTDGVDVAVLNDAGPVLAYEVLRSGILLFSVDEETRVEFQVRALRVYEDTRPLREVLARAMAARLEAGTFGKPVDVKKP